VNEQQMGSVSNEATRWTSMGDGQKRAQQTDGTMPEPFLDALEAGQFLKYHPKTVMHLARQGKLPGHPIGDGSRKHWLFLRSELDIWVRSKVNSGGHPCS
jgi:Helix-turn-helix domain